MIFTDDELRILRRSIELNSGFDDELLQRCSDLMHMGKYDEAVRSAFTLLEERLRKAVDKEGMTGTALANFAFSANEGPLTKILGNTAGEKEGLREIYSGAFKLFRNPSAHGVVGYEAAAGKSIISFVNLLLLILEKAGDPLPPNTFGRNIEDALSHIERGIGPAATSRFRTFLIRCVKAGLKPVGSAEIWIPFKRYALVKLGKWDEPKAFKIPLFYIHNTEKERNIFIPIGQYYRHVTDLDLESFVKSYKGIGFEIANKGQDLRAELAQHNDANFFSKLLDILTELSQELDVALE